MQKNEMRMREEKKKKEKTESKPILSGTDESPQSARIKEVTLVAFLEFGGKHLQKRGKLNLVISTKSTYEQT